MALSAFTHLWNPIGFPSIYLDENTYMRRAIVVLEGGGPIDKFSVYPPYDHPFFGQIFLASVFRTIAYPELFIHSIANGDIHAIETFYSIPRIVMGTLAVIDTFLIFKISERRYNSRNIALIASVLFAVMPMTWLLKMIMLESIQLPLILSALLFTLFLRKDSKNNNKNKNIAMALLSGIFVGLAILTKMPALSIIPLGTFLVYTNTRDLKILGLWLIPVIFIPMIWPIYAFSIGDFKYWLDGVYLQTHRGQIVYKPVPLYTSIKDLFDIDPVLMTVGSAAILFAAIRRDLFLLLWSVPQLIFFYFIHSQFFLLTPILPAFCITTAKMINHSSNIFSNKKIRALASLSAISAIGFFGLISITLLITTNLNSAYFQALALVAKYLSNNDSAANNNSTTNNDKKLAVVSEDRYYWIPQKVLHESQYYKLWDGITFSKSEKAENVLLIFDDPVRSWLISHSNDMSNVKVRNLQAIYNTTFPLAVFEENKDLGTIGNWNPSKIEIRSNRTADILLNSSAFIANIRNGTVINDGSEMDLVIPTNQSGSLPLYWNDFLRNCVHIFRCTINSTTGWQNIRTSFQLSTDITNKSTWSSIYGKEINVKPDEQYQLVTHMKLNKFATQSHIKIEGYNQTSNKWYQITQCPSGINGPLDWHEYRCMITIPKDTTKIRPVLNAGWSSLTGKQAVTLFDAIYLSKTYSSKISQSKTSYIDTTSANTNLVSNSDFVDINIGRFVSSCQFRGDFDIQVSYKALNKSPSSNLVRLSLIAQDDNKTSDNQENSPMSNYSVSRYITIDTPGKLRMVRSNSTLEGYYYSLGRWVPIHFSQVNAVDVNILLQIGTHAGPKWQQPVKIVFDDHIVNKGRVVNCQTK